MKKNIIRLTESDLVRLVKRVINEQSENKRLEFFKSLIDDWVEDNDIPNEEFRPKMFHLILKHAYNEGNLTDDELKELHDYANKVYSDIIENKSVTHFTYDEAYFFRIVKPQLMQNGFKETEEAIKKRHGKEFFLVYEDYPNNVHVIWNWERNNEYCVYGNTVFDKFKKFKLDDINNNESVAKNVVKYALSLKK